jgi:hypothetical protein
MRPLVLWCVVTLYLVVSPAVSRGCAQRLSPPVFAPFVSDLNTGAPAARLQPAGLFPAAPDYRWEGLVVGGAILGVLGIAVGRGFCGYDDSAVKKSCLLPTINGFLIGATVGGVTGGLLGSAIPKSHPPPP